MPTGRQLAAIIAVTAGLAAVVAIVRPGIHRKPADREPVEVARDRGASPGATATAPTSAPDLSAASERDTTAAPRDESPAASSSAAPALAASAQAARSASRDRTPPHKPRNVRATAVSDTTVEVTWAAPADDDVAGYEVVRAGGDVLRVEGTRVAESGLRIGGSYCYSVTAIDRAGNRSPATDLACAAPPDILAPTVPDGLTAQIQSPNSVLLTWSASEDDSGRVWYEVLDGSTVLATINATSWQHRYAEPRDHRYAVRALDDVGNRSASSAAVAVSLTDLEPPTTPGDVTLEPVSPTQLAVRWTAASDNLAVDHYEVLSGAKVLIVSRSTSAVAHALGEFEEHCLAVRAVDGAGNRSAPTATVCQRTMDRAEWDRRRVATGQRGNGEFYRNPESPEAKPAVREGSDNGALVAAKPKG